MSSSEDVALAESAIVAFCAALNAPVVHVDPLDPGPARAGILLARDTDDDLHLWVRIRLIASGEGVTYEFQGDPGDLVDSRVALESALRFSEGMGFLFEQDMIARSGKPGRARANRIWTSLFAARQAEPANASRPETAATPTSVLSRFCHAGAEPVRIGRAATEQKPGAHALTDIQLASQQLGTDCRDHKKPRARLLGSV